MGSKVGCLQRPETPHSSAVGDLLSHSVVIPGLCFGFPAPLKDTPEQLVKGKIRVVHSEVHRWKVFCRVTSPPDGSHPLHTSSHSLAPTVQCTITHFRLIFPGEQHQKAQSLLIISFFFFFLTFDLPDPSSITSRYQLLDTIFPKELLEMWRNVETNDGV